MRHLFSAVVLITAVTLPGAAEPPKAIVLKASRIFDGRTDRVASPGLIVVEGSRIVGVGEGAQVPKDAVVRDLGDATLMPGFIDAHTHLTGEAQDDWKQELIDGLQKTTAEKAFITVAYARRTLEAGFTTVRDLGAEEFVDVGLRNAIRDGTIPGPRMLVAVTGIGATGGHCDPTGGFREGALREEAGVRRGVADGPDAIRAAVRHNVKYGADVIKTCATGGVLSLADDVDPPQLTQAELDALVDEAHALRRKAAAHAHGAEGAKRALRAGIDSIEHGSLLDEEALDMMKARGAYLVPTLMAYVGIRERLERVPNMPPHLVEKARVAAGRVEGVFRLALAKGVKIAFGTDAYVYPHGRNAEEFGRMVALGMKPEDALRSAMSSAADLLGLGDRIGTLEPGKIADIIAVPGDPTREIGRTEKVFFVMKEGTIWRDETRGR